MNWMTAGDSMWPQYLYCVVMITKALSSILKQKKLSSLNKIGFNGRSSQTHDFLNWAFSKDNEWNKYGQFTSIGFFYCCCCCFFFDGFCKISDRQNHPSKMNYPFRENISTNPLPHSCLSGLAFINSFWLFFSLVLDSLVIRARKII